MHHRLRSDLAHVMGPAAARVLVLGALVLTYFGTSPSVAAGSAAVSAPTLQIETAPVVAVGEPITVTLQVAGAPTLGGYETTLLFNPGAAHFSGLQQRTGTLSHLGRTIEPLGPVALSNGVTFGLFTCPFAACVHPGQAPPTTAAAPGAVTLAQVVVVPDQAGALQLRFAASTFVDTHGQPLAVAAADQVVTVQVGPSATPFVAAPDAPPAALLATPHAASAQAGPFTHPGQSRVTYGDLMDAALAWTRSRELGQACGAALPAGSDVNHDGCLDVADLQLLADQYGVATRFGLQSLAATPRLAAAPVTFTVNSTADLDDANPSNPSVCDDGQGVCTLRAALTVANLQTGPTTIDFNIPGSGVQVITITSVLPALANVNGPITIDGYSQPGSAPNTSPSVDNAVINVEISGAGNMGLDAFYITSANNVVEGLSVYDMRRPFLVYGSGATGNMIIGDIIGTNVAATYFATAHVNSGDGVDIAQSATGNYVGNVSLADRNMIGGNPQHGIYITDEGTDYNYVYNNIDGLSPDGTRNVPNFSHGIHVGSYASYNYIGGLALNEHNVFSGNGGEGIEVTHGELTYGNQVIGNYVGTDVTGNAVAPYTGNAFNGIHIEDGVRNNTIAYNVVGGNGVTCCSKGGITIEGIDHLEGNQVYNNWVGISPNGTAIPNYNWGVGAYGDASLNTIGPGNIIANNQNGVEIQSPSTYTNTQGQLLTFNTWYNTITQNSIYNTTGPSVSPSGIVTTTGLGINLFNNGAPPGQGPNQDLAAPVLSSATPQEVSGTTCVTCTVEVFIADQGAGAAGSGKTFGGRGAANPDGTFGVVLTGTVALGAFVTADATDAQGNTSEFSQNLVVSATGTPAPTAVSTASTVCPNVVAADSFNRVLQNDDWGKADIGGVYALNVPVEPATHTVLFGVNGTAGTMVLSTTTSLGEAILSNVSVQDVDIKALVAVSAIPVGDTADAMLVGRNVGAGTEYRGQIAFGPGTLTLQAQHTYVGGVSDIGSPVTTAVTYGPNAFQWVEMQLVSTSPTTTTINLKTWPEGQPEPGAWAISINDSDPLLQTAGGVGLAATVGPQISNVPLTVSFENMQATNLDVASCGTPTATPSITMTPVTTTTPTGTATPTSTSTSPTSATGTSTPTPGATGSATPPPTVIRTATPTGSPVTATATATGSPFTATPTATGSPVTATPTGTGSLVTAVPTATGSPVAATSTSTPVIVVVSPPPPIPTNTFTPVPTTTSTPTSTPTETPTVTSTPTQTSTPIPATSPTLQPTPTFIPGAPATPAPPATNTAVPATAIPLAVVIVHNEPRTVLGGRVIRCDLLVNLLQLQRGCVIISSISARGARVVYTLTYPTSAGRAALTDVFTDTADFRGHSLHIFNVPYLPPVGSRHGSPNTIVHVTVEATLPDGTTLASATTRFVVIR